MYSRRMVMRASLPPSLKPGDKIGILATSSHVRPGEIDAGAAAIRAYGFETVIHPQIYLQDGQAAGTADVKLTALHEFIDDPSIRAVWAARGGNRSIDLLPDFPFDRLARDPKWIIGYSDLTVLLNAITRETGISTLHAPVVKGFETTMNRDHTISVLCGRADPAPMPEAKIARGGTGPSGVIEGPLLGGNLAVFETLLGTAFMPDLSGAILFLEDVSMELSCVDRALAHLRLAGVFDKIGALMFGQFVGMTDTGQPFGLDLETILMRNVSLPGHEFPVLLSCPFGHDGLLPAFPIGQLARLDLSQKALFFPDF